MCIDTQATPCQSDRRSGSIHMSPRWGYVFLGGVVAINILPLTGLKIIAFYAVPISLAL